MRTSIAVQVAANSEMYRACALVVWDGGVSLNLHQLRDDTPVADPGCEVESGVAGLVTSVHHLLHEPH